ncbi:MAG TPA: hypothetical protein VG759_24210 [Candidatus Angelobacter sp.]|nr:hypothetical protein [Candidatus Angelobacter sp.]
MDALSDEGFESDLANALKTIQKSDFDTEFNPHGKSGHDFSFPINAEFLLVFRRETDRDAQGKPLLVHLYLKTIERT